MIESFLHKGLKELFETGTTSKIAKEFHPRIVRRLDTLDSANTPNGMAVPGFNFHPLKGFDPTRYSVHVNGPWCITFEFKGENACRVDFEQYH